MILQVEHGIRPATSAPSIWTPDLQLLDLGIQLLIQGVLHVCLVRSTALDLFGAGFAVEPVAAN